MIFNFKLISGIILLEADIEEKHGFVAFDTGAMHTALNSRYFSKEGMNKETVKFTGETQSDTSIETNTDINIGKMEVKNTKVIITDLDYVEKALKSAVPDISFLGSLGIEIIKEHVWKIDYKNKILYTDEICDVHKHKHTIYFKDEFLPVANISINGKDYKFIIDTGANTCLLDNKLSDISFEQTENNSMVILPELMLSDVKFNNITAILSDISSIQEVINVSGVIGYQVLKDFVCTFKTDKLYLD